MEYRPILNGCLKDAGMDKFSDYVGEERIPTANDIDVLLTQAGAGGVKNKAHEPRVIAGLQCLKRALGTELVHNNWSELKLFLGKRFEDTLNEIITNSKRPDLHFLPADREDLEWSAIPLHSVALLRYPITIPIEVLNKAIRSALQDTPEVPVPVKILRLREEFTGDLTSRFAALFARVGSPDFRRSDVENFKNEILK
jgi:hypothetical protein